MIPEVLEQQMGELLGTDCILLPAPDKALGQKLVLVLEHQGENTPVDHWLALLKNHLAPHEVPRDIIAVDSLPRNAAYKPDRNEAIKLLNT